MPEIVQLDDLLLKWDEERDAGREVAPEELCKNCPELLEEVKRRIATIAQMDARLGVRSESDGCKSSPRLGFGSSTAPLFNVIAAADFSTNESQHTLSQTPSGSAESLVDRLRHTLAKLTSAGLLDSGQSQELENPIRRGEFSSTSDLLQSLIRRGWLTEFQMTGIYGNNLSYLMCGQYLLLDQIGRGGMGTVFKARHRRIGKLAAIKLMQLDMSYAQELAQRFMREAQVLGQMSHPNLVSLYDVGESGGQPFLVMEYVEGIDLFRKLQRDGPLSVVEACFYLIQTALGLQYAFEQGVVHRDIKPSNLMVTGDGLQLRILDFGLARVIANHLNDEKLRASADQRQKLRVSSTPITSSRYANFGIPLGTTAYMAPEQLRDPRSVDIRSDLYSLGCTFYHCLTGRLPFEGTDLHLCLQQREGHAPIGQFRSDVPAEMIGIIRQLMALAPSDRFQTPTSLLRAMDSLTGNLPPLLRARVSEAIQTVSTQYLRNSE
jgi:serine/threonine-protein kinase